MRRFIVWRILGTTIGDAYGLQRAAERIEVSRDSDPCLFSAVRLLSNALGVYVSAFPLTLKCATFELYCAVNERQHGCRLVEFVRGCSGDCMLNEAMLV